ncbi:MULTISPECIES: hypothetical protein [Pseudomonas]|uniref:Dolichyl-phosphate-mannose-protein mannosyltransferase n=1 Tax=Pseudomonas azadiae TaxID=2843612 RepID=A0ABS6P261_9PSED|nr:MULTISPECIES: hypothetical protein [Pseudomonas]MBV4454533.1 hypothetical protein [Pseudomonas azadiae]NMF39667.1 hypothetical protein [Pseudomonas sp. SWRI 103]
MKRLIFPLEGQSVYNRYLNLVGLASIIFSVVSVAAFYPGAMTWDSMDQLRQARAGEYTDWQPPAMAFIWSLLLNISDSPGGMLIFHYTLLWATALILFKWCIREEYRFGFLFLLLPILPWILNFQFTIWKDVGMAYAWGLAIAICIYFRDQNKFPRAAAIFVMILFVYGSLVRSNSLSASAFLMPFLAMSIFKLNTIKSTIAFMVLGCAITILAHLSVGALLQAKKTNSVSYVMFDDVMALKLRAVDVPLNFLTVQEVDAIRHCEYLNTHEIGAAFCISDEKFTSITREHYAALKAAWLESVPSNLSVYASFRVNAFLNLIRSPSLLPYYYNEFHVKNPPFTVGSETRTPSTVERLVNDFVNYSAQVAPSFFKPYAWLLASMILTLYFKVSRVFRGTSLWLLPMSGLSYVLAYLPITPAADLRYAYWLCFITTISFFALINIKSQKKTKPI